MEVDVAKMQRDGGVTFLDIATIFSITIFFALLINPLVWVHRQVKKVPERADLVREWLRNMTDN